MRGTKHQEGEMNEPRDKEKETSLFELGTLLGDSPPLPRRRRARSSSVVESSNERSSDSGMSSRASTEENQDEGSTIFIHDYLLI